MRKSKLSQHQREVNRRKRLMNLKMNVETDSI